MRLPSECCLAVVLQLSVRIPLGCCFAVGLPLPVRRLVSNWIAVAMLDMAAVHAASAAASVQHVRLKLEAAAAQPAMVTDGVAAHAVATWAGFVIGGR